jgi:pimeloyl-ACP methyl ester carboxylesterase
MSDLSLPSVSSFRPSPSSTNFFPPLHEWEPGSSQPPVGFLIGFTGPEHRWPEIDLDAAVTEVDFQGDALDTIDTSPLATPSPATRDLGQRHGDAAALPAGLDWALVGQFGTLSEAVYSGAEVAGFERLERYATDSSSGLQAEVHRPVDGGPVVVTVAGTDMWSLRDWVTNVLQALSLSPLGVPRQYREALDLVERVRSEFGENVVVTGHSLGGAIATYTGMRTGTPVVSFNAAGLAAGADATLRRHGALDASRVVQVRVDGELLSSEPVIPLPGLPQLHGTVVTIPPAEPLPEIDSIGEFFGNFLGRQVRRAEDHRIGNVLAAIANERQRTTMSERAAP